MKCYYYAIHFHAAVLNEVMNISPDKYMMMKEFDKLIKYWDSLIQWLYEKGEMIKLEEFHYRTIGLLKLSGSSRYEKL